MSRPPKRKTKPARARSKPRPERGFDAVPSPAPIFESALRAGRGIHAATDPLEAEVFASGILGTFDRPLVDVPDAVDFLGERLVNHLIGKRSLDALALLHAVAAVADEPLAVRARAGIARLQVAGRADPAFARSIGRSRFVDAWTSIDEYGDQEMVAVAFADPADRTHALCFMIDHNFDGLAREAFLAPDLEAVRTSWSKTSGMAIVGLDAQGLADRLGQGLRMFDTYIDPPCSDDMRELAVLMKARLRALPAPRERVYREVGDKERKAVVSAFVASREAGGSDIAWAARFFVDYRYDYTDGDPLRWSPIAVELCLVDWFPRKTTLDDAEMAALPDALRRFVRYAGRRKGLSKESIAETLAAVDHFEPKFRSAMGDRTRFGPAKSIASAMMAEGVDLTDERGVSDWIGAFNARPLEARDEILGSMGTAIDHDPDADDDDDPDTAVRRRWTIPPMAGKFSGIDAATLDPADPDERRMLIEFDHPELLAALERRDDEVEIDGPQMNPRLHIALHEIIANQLWDGNPPDTWEAAQRLRDLGHARHEILHMLAGAVSGVVWTGLQPDLSHDLKTDMRTALRALPGGLSTKGGDQKPH